MIKIFTAIFWRDWLYFKKRIISITASSLISPALYILTFGLGLGRFVKIGNSDYLTFLIPGIIAINTMNTSFGATATPLVIARLHDHTLEEYICAPVSSLTFVFGKVSAGALRGVYSALIIILFSFLLKTKLHITPGFFMLVVLNSLVFSSLGFFISMVIKSHLDMSRFRNFIITPMVFVCGTFFSVDSLPASMSHILFFLPLTPASVGLRAIALHSGMLFLPLLIQLAYLFLFLFLGHYFFYRVE